MSGGRRARWGWHQLSADWARRLVADAGIRPGELVVDIGAGHGALTAPLVEAGARVLAVELHPRRAQFLRERFAAHDVRVLELDALDLRLPTRPFSVVANPPFALTTALLRRLLHPRSRLCRAELVVPRHVAARWAGGRGAGAGRGASRRFATTRGRAVPAAAFDPRPPGEVAVLRIRRHGLDTR